MMEQVEKWAEYVAKFVEVVGVAVIAIGGIAALVRFFVETLGRKVDGKVAYQRLRHGLGKAILLGLEFLVAGDIIATVSIQPSFESVGVLAVIVVIRTFLSFSLEIELEGRWPWQKKAET